MDQWVEDKFALYLLSFAMLCSYVDSNSDRLAQASEAGVEGFLSLEEGIAESPDIAFVCTSSDLHADIIIQLISDRNNVFTELNLAQYSHL